ncbi:hypothetical protein EV356DRAFT_490220 [Viridothelium virens]|uniref:Uncharacterized protein n=1 Tax=Viridothelium virens TaxID=1048519 RepID=A0A6A6H0L5_VIRVR|nr:hypothetical protein EV356DRAFT_490220 [Viridothelium virens]
MAIADSAATSCLHTFCVCQYVSPRVIYLTLTGLCASPVVDDLACEHRHTPIESSLPTCFFSSCTPIVSSLGFEIIFAWSIIFHIHCSPWASLYFIRSYSPCAWLGRYGTAAKCLTDQDKALSESGVACLRLRYPHDFGAMALLDPMLYTVAWLAPLEIEAQAALHMLDSKHEGWFALGRGDDYVFEAGEVCGHNVIIATLPAGEEYGNSSAAALASQVKRFFPNLWFSLLVGVAAGLPNLTLDPPRDIRLGDVLVSLPISDSTGIIAYELGKETGKDTLELLHSGHILARTETVVRSAIGSIKKAPDDTNTFLPHYEKIKRKKHTGGTFIDPGQDRDKLYEINDNGDEHVIQRELRPPSRRVQVWYGPIGSGDKLIKNAQKRNELRDKYGFIGLEMEAAGTINRIPVGVIRGVCDYADKHKNKEWQPFAAAMAAAYAKAILFRVRPKEFSGPSLLSAGRKPHPTTPDVGDPSEEFNIPFSTEGIRFTSRFVDRDEMQLLEDYFYSAKSSTQCRKMFVIHGLGGMGKTQLAYKFAHNHQRNYTAVFWLDGSTRDQLELSLAHAARRLPLSQLEPKVASGLRTDCDSIEAKDLVRAFLNWLSVPTNTHWLLVVDNVDRDHKGAYKDPQAYNIEDYIPPVDHGSIIVTSRLASLSQSREGFKLANLDKAKSREVLEKNAGKSLIGVEALIRMLDGLPLALTHAGTFIRETDISASEYVEIYQDTWASLMEEQDKFHLDEYDRPMLTTWMVSYEQVKRQSEEAAGLLKLWGFLNSDDVWYQLLATAAEFDRDEPVSDTLFRIGESRLAYASAIKILSRYSLVDANNPSQATLTNSESGHSMHKVLHQWCKQLSQGQERIAMAMHALALVIEISPDQAEEDWKLMLRLLPHATEVCRYITDEFCKVSHRRDMTEIEAWRLHQLGTFLMKVQKTHASEKLLHHALQESEKLYDSGGLYTSCILGDLGAVNTTLGRFEEAEHYLKRALIQMEKEPGLEDLSIFHVIHNLGHLCITTEKYGEADNFIQRALEGKKRLLGERHPSTLRSIRLLGDLYYEQRRLSEAQTKYEEVLRAQEFTLGANHMSTLDTVHNLGHIFQQQGNSKGAEEMYLRALQGTREAVGPSNFLTVLTAKELFHFYERQERICEALEVFEPLMNETDISFGAEHASTLSAAYSAACLYKKQQQFQEAERLFQSLLPKIQKIYGVQSYLAIYIILHLGQIYARLAQTQEETHGGFSEKFEKKKKWDRLLSPMKTICHTSGSEQWFLFGILGHLLLWACHERDAETAFKHEPLSSLRCDVCDRTLDGGLTRAKCRVCYDVDICSRCYGASESKRRIPDRCEKHTFFVISYHSYSRACQFDLGDIG